MFSSFVSRRIKFYIYGTKTRLNIKNENVNSLYIAYTDIGPFIHYDQTIPCPT